MMYRAHKVMHLASFGFCYIFFNMLSMYFMPHGQTDRSYAFFIVSYSVVSLAGLLYGIVILKNKVLLKIHKVLTFALLVTVIEMLISLVIGFILIRNFDDPLFDFGEGATGYALAFTPFSKLLSPYGYIYILTFVTSLLIAIINEYKIKYGLVFLYLFCILFYKKHENITFSDKMIILPENIKYSSTTDLSYPKNKYDYIIEGDEITSDGKIYNISRVYDFKNNTQHITYKYSLFPMGEYIPYSATLYETLWKDKLTSLKSRQLESRNENKIIEIDGKKVLILLCSDAWTYKSISRFNGQKIDYIIIQRNDRVFSKNPLYPAQIDLYRKVLGDYFKVPIIDITTASTTIN